jgi:sulfatase modifying factor 1
MTRAGWQLVPGATWHHPLGASGPAAPADHPVTQVAWNDAVAFCEAEGGRLPTEVEWEHAARNARNDRRPYAWGDSLVTHDAGSGGHGEAHHHANTWNGTFPTENTGADGYELTSPVGVFGETDLGLTDLGGNVWEWTADWFRPYAERDEPFTPTPQSEKVQRGGSFLCHPSYCHGYRVSARSHATPESSLFHVGFRCARNAG